MEIPFVKAEGAGNDFLISREELAPPAHRARIARAICNRHQGVGADGWYLVRTGPPLGARSDEATEGVDAHMHLYNSDGSEAELSGNGTRCVVAWLAAHHPGKSQFTVSTGAGIRRLSVLEAKGRRFRVGMQMGIPRVFAEETVAVTAAQQNLEVRGNRVDPGNPQFAVEVDDFAFDWKDLGRELEGHPTFPQRSNISFYRVTGPTCIAARFYERGAGATLSSGTGSTGALAAAIYRGKVAMPAVVETEAGPLHFRDDEGGMVLTGEATLLVDGIFFWNEADSVAPRG